MLSNVCRRLCRELPCTAAGGQTSRRSGPCEESAAWALACWPRKGGWGWTPGRWAAPLGCSPAVQQVVCPPRVGRPHAGVLLPPVLPQSSASKCQSELCMPLHSFLVCCSYVWVVLDERVAWRMSRSATYSRLGQLLSLKLVLLRDHYIRGVQLGIR